MGTVSELRVRKPVARGQAYGRSNPYPLDAPEHFAFQQAMEDIASYRAIGKPDAIEAMADGLEAHPGAHEDGPDAARLEALMLRREANRLRSQG